MIKHRRLLGAAALGAVVAVALGVSLALTLGDDSSEAQSPNSPTSATGLPTAPAAQLREAAAKMPFPVKAPTRFPTSASRFAGAEAAFGPNGQGTPMFHLLFQGDPFTAKGFTIPSSLDMFQLNVRLLSPNGSLLAQDVAGHDLYKDVVDSDDVHGPIKVTYMALRDGETLVMDFTGEQPTLEGMRDMLASLVVVK